MELCFLTELPASYKVESVVELTICTVLCYLWQQIKMNLRKHTVETGSGSNWFLRGKFIFSQLSLEEAKTSFEPPCWLIEIGFGI